MIEKYLTAMKEDAKEWAEGRQPWLRGVLWLYFLYMFLRYIGGGGYSSLFSGINLGIHELGHVVLSFAPDFVAVLGGTLFQLAAPAASFLVFLKQRDHFALTASFAWLAASLFEAGRYAGDAQRMLLPLVSPFGSGEDVIHDWNYMLGKLGMLGAAPLLGAFFWLLGALSMVIGLFWGGWLIYMMFRER